MINSIYYFVLVLFVIATVQSCDEQKVNSYESCVQGGCAINKDSTPPRRCTTKNSIYEEMDARKAQRIGRSCQAHADCTVHMPELYGLRCCAEQACNQLNNPSVLFTKAALESIQVVNNDDLQRVFTSMCLNFWNTTAVKDKCAHPSSYNSDMACLSTIYSSTSRGPRLYDTQYGSNSLRVYCDSNLNQCKYSIIEPHKGSSVLHPVLISLLILILVIITIWIVVNGISAFPSTTFFGQTYETLKDHASFESDSDGAFDDLFDAPEMDLDSLSDNSEKV
mmetsp:Transcript_5363/g.7908  ORF Transcript_5363/g.7908 Transcript_5363/m.7908 type:complete len:279 (-) Transcript_5363:12-848(-)